MMSSLYDVIKIAEMAKILCIKMTSSIAWNWFLWLKDFSVTKYIQNDY